jgi:hypothetical protein
VGSGIWLPFRELTDVSSTVPPARPPRGSGVWLPFCELVNVPSAVAPARPPGVGSGVWLPFCELMDISSAVPPELFNLAFRREEAGSFIIKKCQSIIRNRLTKHVFTKINHRLLDLIETFTIKRGPNLRNQVVCGT